MNTLLVLEEVSKAFGGVRALENVSLSLDGGEILAVAGPGGVGKTTLVDVIAGVHRPDSGRICFDGRDVTGFRPDRACAVGIGRSFDPPRPFGGLSVEDGVTVAALLREGEMVEARRRALEIIERLGLAAVRGLPAAALTMPERRWLELARVLATGPRLVLLDEPLAELSASDCQQIGELLRALVRRGRVGVLLTVEDACMVSGLTDRILTLDHGELVS
ncbi:MAG: ATP-binding cassette domain-containing protein [Rhodospirillaceae bacterium]